MVTTAVTGVSPLRTLLGLRTALRCRATTSPLSSSCVVFPSASLHTVAAAPVSALRPDSKDRNKAPSSGPTSLTSQLNLKPRSYHDHPNSWKMEGILSSNRKKDPLLPFAGPSPPGSSSGDNPEADNQTSGPDLSAEEKRRQKLRDNMFKDGELGKRGEEYVVIQMLLFAGIAFPPDFLFSSFPPLAFFEPSDVWYLNYVAGAALLGIGGWFSSNAVKDLGTNLSPFPKPPTDSELETGGTYAIVRHPIYSGALLVASGLTLLTCSTGRGILTVLLLILFDKKAAVEEGFLIGKYGRKYEEYKQKVKKLIPYIY